MATRLPFWHAVAFSTADFGGAGNGEQRTVGWLGFGARRCYRHVRAADVSVCGPRRRVGGSTRQPGAPAKADRSAFAGSTPAGALCAGVWPGDAGETRRHSGGRRQLPAVVSGPRHGHLAAHRRLRQRQCPLVHQGCSLRWPARWPWQPAIYLHGRAGWHREPEQHAAQQRHFAGSRHGIHHLGEANAFAGRRPDPDCLGAGEGLSRNRF